MKENTSAAHCLNQCVTAWKEGADRLAALIADDPIPQWNAYCEFVYAFVFIAEGYLGRALLAQGRSRERVERYAFEIHRAILTVLLTRRSNVKLGTDEADKMYLDHQEVLEQRAELWARMPMFEPEEAKGSAGSLSWEVPKQAARSALGDESTAGPKLTQASLRFSQEIAAIREAMRHFASML